MTQTKAASPCGSRRHHLCRWPESPGSPRASRHERCPRLERRAALRETGGARSAMNGANTQIPMSTEQKAGRMLTRAEKQSGSARGREPSAIRAAWCRRPRRLFSVVPRAHSRSPSRWAVSWAARSRLNRAFAAHDPDALGWDAGPAELGKFVRISRQAGGAHVVVHGGCRFVKLRDEVINPIEGFGARQGEGEIVSSPSQ